MLWCVSCSTIKKGLKDKNKAAPAWTSRGPSRQLPMPAPSAWLSLPHTAADRQTSPFDPSACDPPQKHKPMIYYKNFSADSEHIPASRQSSHAAHPPPASAPWLGRAEAGLYWGNRNH